MNILQSEHILTSFVKYLYNIIYVKNVFKMFIQNYQIFLCLERRSSYIYIIVKNVISLFLKFLKHFISIFQFSKNSRNESYLLSEFKYLFKEQSLDSHLKKRPYHSIFGSIKFILVS